jgi:hypothetical protein
MLVEAIEKISGFTRPLHSILRTHDGQVTASASTLFFVNDNGVAITCKHVADLVVNGDPIWAHYEQFKLQKRQIPLGKGYRAALQSLETKFSFKRNTTVQIKNIFVNCGDFSGITCLAHPDLDLAIIRLEGFHNKLYTNHATFLNDSGKIKQGRYLCRLGYPFPEFNNFRLNPDSDNIEWTQEGNTNSPAFPIDGIITRYIGSEERIIGIEMSTPGLRGQSGGPLFDSEGLIYGMQYATNHLHLGFDVKDLEIVNNGNKEKVSDSAFLHVGLCVHVDRIKEFLRDNNIEFFEQ